MSSETESTTQNSALATAAAYRRAMGWPPLEGGVLKEVVVILESARRTVERIEVDPATLPAVCTTAPTLVGDKP